MTWPGSFWISARRPMLVLYLKTSCRSIEPAAGRLLFGFVALSPAVQVL
jgi:hypothetical protein